MEIGLTVDFFVLEPDVIDYIQNDNISWEGEPLEKLSREQKYFCV